MFANACGAFGTSADYLERTRIALVAHGIVDTYLEKLAAEVAARSGVVDSGNPALVWSTHPTPSFAQRRN